MIGIVIVTHGQLAQEFLCALEHIVGAQTQTRAIGIDSDSNVTSCRQDIIDAVHQVDYGDGVVIVTDMFGGTPSNLAISISLDHPLEVIAGVNLPMLIKLAQDRQSETFQKIIDNACRAGRHYINTVSSIMDGQDDG